MDFKEKKENLAHLSPKELSDILVLLGDWLPVARQVVSIKAAFSKKPIDREYLEKNLKENLTIDEYVEWKQCGPYSLIVGEVHDQLKKLVDEGDSKIAKNLGKIALDIGEQTSELLAEPDYWEMGLEELREWLKLD